MRYIRPICVLIFPCYMMACVPSSGEVPVHDRYVHMSDQGVDARDMTNVDSGPAPESPRDMSRMQEPDVAQDMQPSRDMSPLTEDMAPVDMTLSGDMAPVDMSHMAVGCDVQGVTLCDDFEAGVLGAHYREVNFGPSAIALDSTRAHGGTQSVKVTASGFTQMLATDVPAPRFYGRVYIMSDTPMNPGHNTYINAGEGDGDPNHGEWVRIGEHRAQLEINRKSDDAELLSSGDYNSLDGATQFAPDVWYCVEFLFDGPGREVEIWVDGDAVEKLHATDWGAEYETFKFGYERYHGPDKTLWYDDLALGTQRIGCR